MKQNTSDNIGLVQHGTWIDEDDNVRSDCIDCGKKCVEGNRCFDCWEKAGCKWTWNNQEVGKLYKPKGKYQPDLWDGLNRSRHK